MQIKYAYVRKASLLSIILCEKCKDQVPSKSNEKEFDNLFLRFSSTKEFIQYYNAKNEKDSRITNYWRCNDWRH